MMMGAAKKKCGPQTAYAQGVLDEAVQMIRTGRMSVRKASILYQIPKSTLNDHATGRSTTQRKGPQPYLPKDIEDCIVHWLTKMARIGYGQMKESLLDKVQEILNCLNIPTPWENGRPSRHWYELFMKWNSHLKLRQAQLLSRERAGVSHAGLSHWYQELYDYLLSTGNLEIFQQPLRIFNCDEMGFPIAPKPPKIICEVGAPNVYARGSSSKQTITTLLCASAAGTYVRPMIVYPGTNFKREFMTKFFKKIPGGEFGHSPSGWMDQTLFLQWLRNVFDPTLTVMKITRPVLLIIDGAHVHLSLWISEFCDEKNIILYVLHPNSMHLTQPLDLLLMGLVKVHYKEAVRRWIADHLFELYDKFAFPEAFANMWRHVATVTNAVKGFKVTGIYPFNPEAVDQRKLFPADLFMPNRELEPSEVADAHITNDKTPTKPKSTTATATTVTATTVTATTTETTTTATAPVATTSGNTKAAGLVPNLIVFGGKRYQLIEMNALKPEVLDDILKAPGEGKTNERSRTWPRLSGLPRCISSQVYRDMVMQKEEAKKKIEEGKEKHKHERKEAKAKKIAEKEERERNKAIGKGKGKGNGKRKGKALKRKPSTPSTSEDEESDWSSASSEFYEGSTSRCSECDVHFRGQEKQDGDWM